MSSFGFFAGDSSPRLGKGTRELYLKVRAIASAVFYDRPLLDDDIRAARKLVL